MAAALEHLPAQAAWPLQFIDPIVFTDDVARGQLGHSLNDHEHAFGTQPAKIGRAHV